MKKTVFIAHPVSGDIANNIAKALAVCREVHYQGIIPLAPYITALMYLDDTIPEERAMGIDACFILFDRRAFDELWLYGDRISDGMKDEVLRAIELSIPIFAKTPETEKELAELLKNY